MNCSRTKNGFSQKQFQPTISISKKLSKWKMLSNEEHTKTGLDWCQLLFQPEFACFQNLNFCFDFSAVYFDCPISPFVFYLFDHLLGPRRIIGLWLVGRLMALAFSIASTVGYSFDLDHARRRSDSKSSHKVQIIPARSQTNPFSKS